MSEANNIEPIEYDSWMIGYTVQKAELNGWMGGITRLSENGKIDGSFRQDQILGGFIKMSFGDWMIYIKNLKPKYSLKNRKR